MTEVVIVDAVRTPIGRYKGALKSVRPDDLGAIVIKALVERNPGLDVNQIDEVIFGNANGAGEENRNVARMSALIADLPESVSGTTVNRLCGSSLDAVSMAARSIITGEIDIAIAGGTESMSRAPFVMLKPEKEFPRGNMELVDTTIGWRFPNPKIESEHGIDSMPQTAENVAKRYGITREEQDEFAYESQQRAKAAVEADRFREQMVPVTITDRKGNETIVDKDEHPRPETTLEKLSQLRSIFPDGTVTAGNASGVNDGASALLVMSREKAEEMGLTPLVKYTFSATAGVEPAVMGLGPIDSTKKLLEKTGRTISDIGLVELNEAFASQSIECINQLGIDREIVNVNGGAISFGHPLGASGARILTDLIYEMKQRGTKTGLATMCIGVGQGISLMVDNIE
ncbi:thiolase family protein [Salinicoccus kekensis]|uniref:Probable acetyl-CoA acyltransferase n=1 Tax=Salinicoccus kekensis TaxID=714307 RepID=A0A285UJD6_9STAP|nr:acetyl-CoA C-acyltransferase [Salinicoccus kekensis]SOC41873.1 3-oxo-5,6-didehydrosuberyl-CoA/3-oxoadipyl-CoA thiolase [Salinicoccus kekensis]